MTYFLVNFIILLIQNLALIEGFIRLERRKIIKPSSIIPKELYG